MIKSLRHLYSLSKKEKKKFQNKHSIKYYIHKSGCADSLCDDSIAGNVCSTISGCKELNFKMAFLAKPPMRPVCIVILLLITSISLQVVTPTNQNVNTRHSRCVIINRILELFSTSAC